MSFLAPLFLLGALAVVGPVIFHLIRRTTRDRVAFSSLMFLRPTPPRLTKRSRIEHWLLLLLRALIIGLLALAFARPFLKSPDALPPATDNGGRTAILIDVSASMKRDGLWAEAVEKAGSVVREAAAIGDVAVFAFDRSTRTLMSFDDWRSMDPVAREGELRARIEALDPTWMGTDLAAALRTAAEMLVEGDTESIGSHRRLAVISDLQQGGRLETIQSYDWPSGVAIDLHPVAPTAAGNAGLQLAAEKRDASVVTDEGARLRVLNTADSTVESFQVGWAGDSGQAFAGAAVDVYVPPGQSRLVTVPWPAGTPTAGAVRLTGDAQEFDNQVFTAPPPQSQVAVLHFGQETTDDPKQPAYFLKRALPQSPRLQVELKTVPPAGPLPPEPLARSEFMVVTEPLAAPVAAAVRERIEAGTTVLLVLGGAAMAETVSALTGVGSSTVEEVIPSNYAMMGEIDFRHPVFAPFADPRFSNFTKIRFQKYRKLNAATLALFQTLAKFDSGDPALLTSDVGQGRLVVLTTGWVAADSQLAVSSKFPPLLAALMEWSGATALSAANFSVGEPISRLALGAAQGEPVNVLTPAGATLTVAADAAALEATEEPGVHQARTGESTRLLPVNLDPAESRTAPLSADDFERLGVPLAESAERARLGAERTALPPAVEAESRQKLWRWLLAAALVVLLLETVLAGRAARRTATPEAAAP